MEIPSRILRSLPPFKHFLLSCIFGWQREQSELKIWKSAMKNLCRRTNTLRINCFYFRNNWLSLNEYFSIVINQNTFKFMAALIDKNCTFSDFSLSVWIWVLLPSIAPRGFNGSTCRSGQVKIHGQQPFISKECFLNSATTTQFLSISVAKKLKVLWLITMLKCSLGDNQLFLM